MKPRIAVCLLAVIAAVRTVHADGQALLDTASVIPQDVTTYIHVQDAARLRTELRDRPLADSFNHVLQRDSFQAAMQQLLRATGMEGGTFFDAAFGRDCTFASRGSAGEWVVVTQVDAKFASRSMTQLRVRHLSPREEMAICELPEQDLIIAHSGDTLAVGPRSAQGLFNDVLLRMNSGNVGGPEGGAKRALDTHPAAKRARQLARELSQPQVAFVSRLDRPLGGWVTVAASLAGDEIQIKQAALFENPPFEGPVTKLAWNAAPIRAFETHALAAVGEPTDVPSGLGSIIPGLGVGATDTFMQAALGEPVISGEIRANIGDRQFLVLGEIDGRMQEPKVDMLLPAIALCIELKDLEVAERQLDDQMIKLSTAIRNVGEGALLVECPPNRRSLVPGQPRMVDISGAAEWFSGGLPIMKNISLNWTVSDTPQGRYYVIASHPRQLSETTEALSRPVGQASEPQRWACCGTLNGVRLGNQIRSYGEGADLLTDPEEVPALRDHLTFLSGLASGIERCRWQMARPSVQEMKLDIQIKLAAPESAR